MALPMNSCVYSETRSVYFMIACYLTTAAALLFFKNPHLADHGISST